MKHIFAIFSLMVAISSAVVAQDNPAKAINAVQQEIIELEKRFNSAVQQQDAAQLQQMLADSYFLAVGLQGMPLETAPKKNWLENLKFYKIESYSIDDIKVNVYGETAVVLMLWTQKAKVGRAQVDRSAQFVLTDIWVKQKDGWRLAERHSSRPEPPPTITPPAQTVKVDPKVLDTYVGRYEINPGTIVTITREGDKLMSARGGQKFELFPVSETEFSFGTGASNWRFRKNEAGQVTLIIKRRGEDVEVKKMP